MGSRRKCMPLACASPATEESLQNKSGAFSDCRKMVLGEAGGGTRSGQSVVALWVRVKG